MVMLRMRDLSWMSRGPYSSVFKHSHSIDYLKFIFSMVRNYKYKMEEFSLLFLLDDCISIPQVDEKKIYNASILRN